MRFLTLAVFGIGAVLATFSPEATEADKHDLSGMEGTWTMISGIEDGHELPDDICKEARLTIIGDQHVVHVADRVMEGVHKIHASAHPKTIDSTDVAGPFKGRVMIGIYELTEHEFTVCFGPQDHERPADFTAKNGSGRFVHHWKRQ